MKKKTNTSIGWVAYIVMGACFVGLILIFMMPKPTPLSEYIVPEGAVPMDTMELRKVVEKTRDGLTNYTVTTFQRAEMLNDQKFARPATNGSPVDPTPDWVKKQRQQATNK